MGTKCLVMLQKAALYQEVRSVNVRRPEQLVKLLGFSLKAKAPKNKKKQKQPNTNGCSRGQQLSYVIHR